MDRSGQQVILIIIFLPLVCMLLASLLMQKRNHSGFLYSSHENRTLFAFYDNSRYIIIHQLEK